MPRPLSGTVAATVLVFLLTATPVGAQSLCLPTIGSMGRLASPRDIVMTGPYAIVADQFAGLVIVDISMPAEPLQVAVLWMPFADRVEVEGERAYVTDREALHIIDVSHPRAPVEIGKSWLGEPTSALAVANGVAFVGTRTWGASWEGLKVVDVSDPAHPKPIGSMEFSFGVSNLVARDHVLYVGAPGNGLVVLDVSDPSNPMKIGSHEPRGGADTFDVSGEFAFVGTSFDLRILDISDPTRPAEIGVYDPGSSVSKVRVSDGTALVQVVGDHDLTWKTQLVDVSDPHHPLLRYDELGSYGFANEMALSGRRAYIATVGEGIRVFDVSDQTAPEEIGHLDPPPIQAVTCRAGGAYFVGYQSENVEIAAVPAFGDPYLIGSYRAPGDIWDFQISGDRAYAAVAEIGVIVLDSSHPGTLTELATVVPSIEPREIAVSGTTLYVKSWDAIEVIDISNPSAAIPRGRYDFVFDFQFELGPIVSSDGLLFLGVLKLAGPSENELWIFDVSDPEHPTPASISEMPGWDVRDIGVVGDFVYLALDWNGIVVLDVARPESPTILGVYELPLLAGIPNQISVRDGLAVVAVANGSDDSASLVFLNITDPAHPVVRGGQFEGRDARALSLMDGRACLLLDSSQLVILDLDRPYTCPAPRQSSDRLIPRASRRLKFEGVVQREEE